MNRFFVSRSGRSYVLVAESQQFLSYTRETDSWESSSHTFLEVQQENRLQELPTHTEFVHYVRRAYERRFGTNPRRSSEKPRDN